jgi:hypothetical protein
MLLLELLYNSGVEEQIYLARFGSIGDTVRIVVRDNSLNPTLQVFR